MSRESEIEYNRWSLLCNEASAAGIDPNKPKFNGLFRAIALWGESLVAFRVTQTPVQRANAHATAMKRYKAVR
jgi:hypothetical protein